MFCEHLSFYVSSFCFFLVRELFCYAVFLNFFESYYNLNFMVFDIDDYDENCEYVCEYVYPKIQLKF